MLERLAARLSPTFADFEFASPCVVEQTDFNGEVAVSGTDDYTVPIDVPFSGK